MIQVKEKIRNKNSLMMNHRLGVLTINQKRVMLKKRKRFQRQNNLIHSSRTCFQWNRNTTKNPKENRDFQVIDKWEVKWPRQINKYLLIWILKILLRYQRKELSGILFKWFPIWSLHHLYIWLMSRSWKWKNWNLTKWEMNIVTMSNNSK